MEPILNERDEVQDIFIWMTLAMMYVLQDIMEILKVILENYAQRNEQNDLEKQDLNEQHEILLFCMHSLKRLENKIVCQSGFYLDESTLLCEP